MNRRQALGLFGAFAALVVVVVLAAWLFGEGDRTRQLAIAGVGLGSAGALKHLHDIWEKAHERRKRDEEKAEKVRATLTLDGGAYHGMEFKVEVFNYGSTRVAIKKVALTGVFKGHKFCYQLAIPDGESLLRNKLNREQIDIELFPSRVNLEPQEHAVFYLASLLQFPSCPTPFAVKDLIGLEAESYGVVVESFNGELERISGIEIHAALQRQSPMDFPYRIGFPTPISTDALPPTV